MVRPAKGRVIESSSGSENKTPFMGLRKSRHEDTSLQNDMMITIDDGHTNGHQPVSRERTSKLMMSATNNAKSAPASTNMFAAPQQKGMMETRKRMRHEIQTPSSNEKVSPSPSRPINED